MIRTDCEDDGSERIWFMVERSESSKVGFRRCSPSPVSFSMKSRPRFSNEHISLSLID